MDIIYAYICIRLYTNYTYQTEKLFVSFKNDPSAGSPTETLLRLLLPLSDKV